MKHLFNKTKNNIKYFSEFINDGINNIKHFFEFISNGTTKERENRGLREVACKKAMQERRKNAENDVTISALPSLNGYKMNRSHLITAGSRYFNVCELQIKEKAYDLGYNVILNFRLTNSRGWYTMYGEAVRIRRFN